jgi:hypothetical protein
MPDEKLKKDPTKFVIFDPYLQQYGQRPSTAAFEFSRYDSPFIIDPDENLAAKLNKIRAENQGFLAEIGTAAANVVPNTLLTIAETAGHLADIEAWSSMIQNKPYDYSNVLSEWANKNKNVFGEVYQKTPGENNIFDSAWWVSNGAGLVESVAAFAATGYGVGSLLGKGASAMVKGLNAYGKAKMGIELSAQLGTAGTLAFTEGAMTGAQVYKDMFPELKNTKSKEIIDAAIAQYGEENITEDFLKYVDEESTKYANKIAGQSASKAVRINTAINTFLNIPETGALFRSMGSTRYLDDAIKREKGELLDNYIERIKSFDVNKHLTKEGVRNTVKQTVGESLEEMVNVYAEQEGKNVSRKAMGKDIVTLGEMLADDDIWAAAFWGGIGGTMQKFVMNKMPKWVTQEDGTTKRTTIGEYNKEQVKQKYEEQLGDLTDRLTEFSEAKNNLKRAADNNDQKLYEESINKIFNYNSYNSIVKGTEEQLLDDYNQIMTLSPEEAMQQGFKENYRQDAADKIAKIKKHTSEWNKIQDIYSSQDLDLAGYPESIFQQYLNVENNKNIIFEQQAEINKLTTDITQSYALKGTDLTITRYNNVVSDLNALENDYNAQAQQLVNLLNLDQLDEKTKKIVVAELNNKYGNLENAETQIKKSLDEIKEKHDNVKTALELEKENFKLQIDPENQLSDEEKERKFAEVLSENEYEIEALTQAKTNLQRNREILKSQEDELRELRSKTGAQKFRDIKRQKLAEQNEKVQAEIIQEEEKRKQEEKQAKQEVVNDIKQRQEEDPDSVTPEETITLEELESELEEEKPIEGETYKEGQYTGEGSTLEELEQQYEDISESASNTDEDGREFDQQGNLVFVDDKLVCSFDKIAYASTVEYSEDKTSGKIIHTSLQLNVETNPDFLTTKFMPGTPIKLKKLDSKDFKEYTAQRKIIFKDEFGREVLVANAGETVTFEMLSHPYMQPIGIYDADNNVIGMLHDVTYVRPQRVLQQSLEEDRNNLITLRSKIGDTFINTTVNGKTNGHINKLTDGFRKLNELIQQPVEFAIATSTIQLNTSKTTIVDGLINKSNYKVGQVYVITYTPNGQKVAIPVKTTQIKEHEEIMNELLATFDSFADGKISLNDLRNTFSKYLYSAPTSEKLDATGKNFKRESDGKDRHYIDFESRNIEGIIFGKSGRSAKFLGPKTPKDLIEDLRKSFKDTIAQSFINVNFEKLKDQNFLKEYLTSNVRFYSLPDGKVTIFDNPVLSINTSFAGEIKPIEKKEEQPRVAPEPKPVSELDRLNDEVIRLVNIRNNDKTVRQAIIDSNNRKITLEELDAIIKKWNDENGLTVAMEAYDAEKKKQAAPVSDKKADIEKYSIEEGIPQEELIHSSDVFKNNYQQKIGNVADRKQLIKDNVNNTKEESVNVSKIIPTQVALEKDNIVNLRDKDAALPVLLKEGNNYFVIDGHHRIASQINSGVVEIKAKIINAELAALEQPVTPTEPIVSDKIIEYTPQNKIIGYIGLVNKDGSFKTIASNKVEGNSNFQVEDLGNEKYAISVINETAPINTAVSSPELVLNPIYTIKNAHDENAKYITTTKPAIYKKEGDRYVQVEKGEMYYGTLESIIIPKPTEPIVEEVKPEKKEIKSANGMSFTPELDTDEDLLPMVTEVKPGVEELFNNNPELASIGTPAQYSAYLDSIFPDSKVKDIVYHGSPNANKIKEEGFKNKQERDKGYIGDGYYFTKDFSWQSYTGDISGVSKDISKRVSIILNAKNPQLINTEEDRKNLLNKPNVDSRILLFDYNQDLTIEDAIKQNEVRFNLPINELNEIVVFEPEQIHILGNKQDIEGFKNYVESGKQIEKSLSLQNKVDNFINEGKITKFCK